jgi:hypothetical protein
LWLFFSRLRKIDNWNIGSERRVLLKDFSKLKIQIDKTPFLRWHLWFFFMFKRRLPSLRSAICDILLTPMLLSPRSQ